MGEKCYTSEVREPDKEENMEKRLWSGKDCFALKMSDAVNRSKWREIIKGIGLQ